MLPVDNDVREQVLSEVGNIVISSSAGTGKTFTTIQRIIRDAEVMKSFQTFAAITFTRKAAKEILSRLGPNKGDGFVGTNDNFIFREIIQPFMYDVYGNDFKVDIKPDYSDENQIEDFDEGIKKIRATQMMCKYDQTKINFAFQLALDILQKSHSARRYIKSKYYRIYIDEYQDSDVDMHNFFMYLCDELNVPLFIVGDMKQSIYGWRGAYSEGFEGLFTKQGFKKFELWHNFRSNKAIQNYSNIFMDSVREHYQPIDMDDEVTLYKYSDENDSVEYIKKWINIEEKCAILSFSNNDAEKWSNKLNTVGLDFIYVPASPLDNPNLESEHIWIARAIAHYALQYRYSEYDFRDEIPMPEKYRVSNLNNLLKEIMKSKDDFDSYESKVFSLYEYLGYKSLTNKIKNEIYILFNVVNDEKYISTYNQDRYKLTSGTIHSSKGLEFNQVIINAGNYNFKKDGIKFLHYVAVSRPEERLLILAEDGYVFNRYMDYIHSAILETSDLGFEIELDDVICIID